MLLPEQASQRRKRRRARRCGFREMQLLPAKQHQSRKESGEKHTRVSPALFWSPSDASHELDPKKAKGQSSLGDAVRPAPGSKEQGRAEQSEEWRRSTKVENLQPLFRHRAEYVGTSLFMVKTLWSFHLFPWYSGSSLLSLCYENNYPLQKSESFRVNTWIITPCFLP